MLKSRILFVLLSAALTVQYVSAHDWPVDEPVVTSNFGAERSGSFGNGLEIHSGSSAVHPSESGEILFYSENGGPGIMPAGLADVVVIEHERKLRTLYAGIEPSAKAVSSRRLDISETLGLIGPGKRTSLYFSVIDSEFEQYVNPLLLLDSIIDNKAPVIEQVRIITGDGPSDIGRRAVVNAGNAEISVKIYDPCMSDDYNASMVPYKIQLFLNGEEIFYLNFESMRYDPDDTVVQSRTDVGYSDFYDSDGFLSLADISLVPGESRFEILVSDYSENETTHSFSLTVVEKAE